MRARLILSIVAAAAVASAQDRYRQWRVAGGADNIHYSSLAQIDRSNVHKLQVAWRFDSGDEYEGSEMQCNPILAGGLLYATTPRVRVIALDPETGQLVWDFDPHRGEKITGKPRNRGVAYWPGGNDSRVFVGIGDYLYALHARTGRPVAQFGEGGRIDLRKGLGRDKENLVVRANSPGVVYKDTIIVGSLVAEGLPSAPGDIRAFDVRTGAIRWQFHTIPHPGEYGYETWPKDAWKRSGGANAWSGLTLDEKNGMVFASTGSAAFDFYGGDRHGDNLFANCVLALDAATGKRIWHFQAVRHDVWDRDFPAPPALVRVRKDGREVEALAQVAKSGHLWVFDRKTGKPLFPYREIDVPPSTVPGESLSRKQVLPLLPEPFARQQVTEEILSSRTPEVHREVRERFRTMRSGPQFTPPGLEPTVIFPGLDGGGEWGGATWDPETRMLYVNANEMAWVSRLVPRNRSTAAATGRALYAENCAGCHRADLKGTPPEFPSLLDLGRRSTKERVTAVVKKGAGRMPGFAQLGDGKVDAVVHWLLTGEDMKVEGVERVAGGSRNAAPWYGIDGYNKFLDQDGYPAIAPPWGTLNALHLDSARYAWKIPFGEIPELVAKGQRNTGSENYGGGVATAGGLLFIGATNHDRKFHAFDKSSGKLLWETLLPAAGNATPAVYEVNGRQYVVIAAGGGKWGNPSGGSYVAFALP